jgi:hypothetical protein
MVVVGDGGGGGSGGGGGGGGVSGGDHDDDGDEGGGWRQSCLGCERSLQTHIRALLVIHRPHRQKLPGVNDGNGAV